MVGLIETLNKEKNELLDRVHKINNVIETFQKVCKHINEDGSDAMEYEGSNSHKSYYKCTICGHTDWK